MNPACGMRRAKWISSENRDLTDRRSAMTLFELLLVLVLLVIVGSLATPLFEGSFSSIRLRRAGDQILATCAEARTRAIEAGKIYQFRFKPQGADYRVDLWSGGLEVETDEDDLLPQTSPDTTADEQELAKWKLSATLPEQISFSRAESVSKHATGERNVTRLDQKSLSTDWSAPILFYPNGTTSEASILLENERGLYRRVTLRALTGVARASELMNQEDVNRYKFK